MRFKISIGGIKEGEEFKLSILKNNVYKVENGVLIIKDVDGFWRKSDISLGTLHSSSLIKLTKNKKIKLTNTERKILEGRLAEEYKWIVKDKDGEIVFFTDKPFKSYDERSYFSNVGIWSALRDMVFAFEFISWEDKEPTNIEELLKDVEVEE